MTQASGAAAREPSMEEILASIRRIIEDSDSVRRTTGEPEPKPFGLATAGAAYDEPAPEGSADVEAFRNAFREGSATEEVPTTGFVESEAEGGAPDGDDGEAYRPDAQAKAHAQPDEDFPPFQAAPVEEAEDDEPDNAKDPVIVDAAERSAPIAGPSWGMTDQRRSEGEPPVDQANRPAIISEAAGRQVAAAFEELSSAFTSSQKRSFDEIAEELMRPMLQDWLDNNLPVLVERLVREEIERVARGGSGR